MPAEGRQGEPPAWPLRPDIRLTSALKKAEGELEMLEAQVDAGTAPRGAVRKIAMLDQLVAELRDRIEAAEGMESELWVSIWSTPQATMWDTLRWTREVALYTRWQVHAELGDMDAAKEARQWSDRLGLNPTALLRNRWKIGTVAEAEAQRPRRSTSSSRARMKVIAGGATG